MNDIQSGIDDSDQNADASPLEPVRQELDTINDTLDLHTGHLERIINLLGSRQEQDGDTLSEILRLLIKRIDQQMIMINRLNRKFDLLAETVQQKTGAPGVPPDRREGHD